jgi:diaminopimelate epimerase
VFLVKFTKMHGIGNDFVVVNALSGGIDESRLHELSRKVNERKFGVGADGLILVLPSKIADYRMRMFNPDGSEAEMCGNGIRCFAKYVYDRKLIPETQVKVETLAGVKLLKLQIRAGKVEAVRVDMGVPRLQRAEIPMRGDDNGRVINEGLKAEGRRFEITAVSMGNPHVIIFEDNVESFPVWRYGPPIETHKSFPERTNVHFVQVCNQGEIIVRTWERGAGETLACGTGACASVVACVLNDKTVRSVLVHLPGGDLRVEWMGDQRVVMTGAAEEVFEGDFPT